MPRPQTKPNRVLWLLEDKHGEFKLLWWYEDKKWGRCTKSQKALKPGTLVLGNNMPRNVQNPWNAPASASEHGLFRAELFVGDSDVPVDTLTYYGTEENARRIFVKRNFPRKDEV